MKRAAIATATIFGLAGAGHAFDLSQSYAPSAALLPGYYACRSGLDFDSFTSQFDVDSDGRYALRGQDGSGQLVMAADGAVEFDGGPFASDETATTYAMNATRHSDGNPVIIIRYDFGSVVTDDYCAWVR